LIILSKTCQPYYQIGKISHKLNGFPLSRAVKSKKSEQALIAIDNQQAYI